MHDYRCVCISNALTGLDPRPTQAELAQYWVDSGLQCEFRHRRFEAEACSVCHLTDEDGFLLVCDGKRCTVPDGRMTHTHCTKPPLQAVPKGSWYCEECKRKPRAAKHAQR